MRLHFACVVSLVALTNVTLVGQTGFPADNTSYLSWNTKMIKTITKNIGSTAKSAVPSTSELGTPNVLTTTSSERHGLLPKWYAHQHVTGNCGNG